MLGAGGSLLERSYHDFEIGIQDGDDNVQPLIFDGFAIVVVIERVQGDYDARTKSFGPLSKADNQHSQSSPDSVNLNIVEVQYC